MNSYKDCRLYLILKLDSFLKLKVLKVIFKEHTFPYLGKVPFIRANNFVIAEMDPIVGFVNTKVQI